MSALRVARAATGRDRIVKFAGHYHGHVDGLLVQAGSGLATAGLPASRGVTPLQAGDTAVASWNDRESVEALLDDSVAAVICEPLPANMGIVPADDGFLDFLINAAAGSSGGAFEEHVLEHVRHAGTQPAALMNAAGHAPRLRGNYRRAVVFANDDLEAVFERGERHTLRNG